MSVTVRPVTRAEHLAFVAARPSASHLQLPSWGDVKRDWQAESLAGSRRTGGSSGWGWCCSDRCPS